MNEHARFTILLGGDLTATPRLLAQVAGTRVIAADSGMRHARPLGLDPELWTGDFDSVDTALDAAFPDTPRERFPAAKDLTDGEIAVEAAQARGARHLILAGAFGGPRTDHAFLHLALGLRLAERGFGVMLSSGLQEGIPLLPGAHEGFDLPSGTIFSIAAMTDLAGLSLSGVRWPLTDRFVPFGSSLTLSNEVTGTLRIGLRAGRAILIAHPLPSPESA